MRKGELTIGGGSGEHPALVVHEPTHCVARFLYDMFPQDASARSFPSAADRNRFTFCNDFPEQEWIQEFAPFYSHWSDTISFTDWVAIEIGQFVYHTIPDFYDSVSEWRRIYGDLEVQFTMCSISWDRYLGNGSDLFTIARVKA
jgi:hypothetical protein